MARKVAQSDPALEIAFFNSGFYTYRSQLFAPFKGIGVNVVQFKDPILDGANMEITDLFQVSRRPGFSKFCPTALGSSEVINQFYSSRNLNGQVTAFFDSTVQLASFTSAGWSNILTKSTEQQGYVTTVGNMTYFSDGVAADFQKWGTPNGSQAAPVLSAWGLAAPTLTPSVSNLGCWLPLTSVANGTAVVDPNGNVQVAASSGGKSGPNQPTWSTTLGAITNDGSVSWTNYGPILSWLPSQYYPTPCVVLDTNGNLQLATTANNPLPMAYDPSATYAAGNIVSYGGSVWTAGQAFSPPAPVPGLGGSNYTAVVTGSTTTATTTPYWLQNATPLQTGLTAPSWNTTVGDNTTGDGNYTVALSNLSGRAMSSDIERSMVI